MNKSDSKDKQLNRDIHRIANDERFPVSNMAKASREDEEKMRDTDRESLNENVNRSNSKRSD